MRILSTSALFKVTSVAAPEIRLVITRSSIITRMFHSTSIFEFTRKMVDKGVAFLAVQQATSSKIYNWSITNCTMQTPSLWTFPHSPQWVIRLCHKSASKTSRSHENLPCVRIHWQPETHIQGTATPQTHPPTVLQGFMKKRQGSPSFRVS